MASKENGSAIERHAQTILTAVVAGLIFWVGINVTEQGKSIAMLTERVSSLQVQVERLMLKPSINKQDLLIFLQPLKNDLNRHEQNIKTLQHELEKVKADLYVNYINPRKKIDK